MKMTKELRRFFMFASSLALIIPGLVWYFFGMYSNSDMYSSTRTRYRPSVTKHWDVPDDSSTSFISVNDTGIPVKVEGVLRYDGSPSEIYDNNNISSRKYTNVAFTGVISDLIAKLLYNVSTDHQDINSYDTTEEESSAYDNIRGTQTQTDNSKRAKKSSLIASKEPEVTLEDLVSGAASRPDLVSEATSRPDNCKSCFPESSYLYMPPEVCSTTSPKSPYVTLLLLIFTTHENKAHRDTLRRTWASIADKNSAEVRYVFLLGKHKVRTLNKKALEEAKKYGDIVIKDFDEVYRNLTYKTIAGFQWASKFCSNAQYVMKTDDDMWVNTPKILKDLESWDIKNEVVGDCYQTGVPNRDKKSKWYASFREYPRSTYPGFCSGTGYLSTMKVVKDIVKVSPNIPYFYLEDVYVAICIRKLGYTLRKHYGFHNAKVLFDQCLYHEIIITSHYVTLEEVEAAWNAIC
ncbi:unnamed protein product [Owenia fusiformis]|uniref:Hexosyltransferase n=1 Tax=Owenia fusiformis TaxID=6347 RepID=A0A8J1U499_OWEFU|nr:unnamed protein product [Owenia fusiformis]